VRLAYIKSNNDSSGLSGSRYRALRSRLGCSTQLPSDFYEDIIGGGGALFLKKTGRAIPHSSPVLLFWPFAAPQLISSPLPTKAIIDFRVGYQYQTAVAKSVFRRDATTDEFARGARLCVRRRRHHSKIWATTRTAAYSLADIGNIMSRKAATSSSLCCEDSKDLNEYAFRDRCHGPLLPRTPTAIGLGNQPGRSHSLSQAKKETWGLP